MITKKWIWAVLPVILIFSACSATSTSSGTDSGTDTGGDTGGTLTSAFEDLQNQDVSAAQTTYCDLYDADTTDSSAAFGCYLTTQLALLDSSKTTDLLAAVDENVFGTENLFQLFDDVNPTGINWNTFHYGDYSYLPVNGLIDTLSDASPAKVLAALLNNLTGNGQDVGDLKTLILNYRSDYEDMEQMLDVASSDTSFTFSVPAELFLTSDDLTITPTDATFLLAKVKLILVSFDVFEAYDYDLAGDVSLAEGGDDFDYEALVADLNGAGGTVNDKTIDTTPFITLTDSTLVTGATTRLQEALELMQEGFTNLLSDGLTDATGIGVPEDFDWETHVTDYKDQTTEFLSSLADDSEVDLAALGRESLHVNLHHCFNSPPNPADVEADPFVYQDGTIKIVESYFSTLLDGCVSY